jgi:hypothetical protein
MRKAEKIVIAVELILAIISAVIMYLSFKQIIYHDKIPLWVAFIELFFSSLLFYTLLDDVNRIKNHGDNQK